MKNAVINVNCDYRLWYLFLYSYAIHLIVCSFIYDCDAFIVIFGLFVGRLHGTNSCYPFNRIVWFSVDFLWSTTFLRNINIPNLNIFLNNFINLTFFLNFYDLDIWIYLESPITRTSFIPLNFFILPMFWLELGMFLTTLVWVNLWDL